MPLTAIELARGDVKEHKSHLTPDEYHDPTEENLPLSGRSMASALPPGIQGANGTIVKKSTIDGAPIGYDPYAVATRINVDPDINGYGFVMDPSALTDAGLQQAVKDYGIRQATDELDQRERAADLLAQYAITNKLDRPAMAQDRPREAPVPLPGSYVVPKATEGGGQVKMAEQQPAPAPQGVPTTRRPETVIPDPGFTQPPTYNSPAQPPQSASFSTTGRSQPPSVSQPAPAAPQPASMFEQVAAPTAAAPVAHAPAAAHPNEAPTYKIEFEVENGDGAIESWYHEVIRDGHILALCYDTRVRGYPRIKLRSTSKDIAIHIEGSDVFYIATDPEIKFVHESTGMEYQLFLIKQEHPFHAAGGAVMPAE